MYKIPLNLIFFVLLFLSSIIGMVSNDFSDLLPIKGFFVLNLLVESIDFFLKFLNVDLFKTNIAFKLLISV
jgi:hypothetical protein